MKKTLLFLTALMVLISINSCSDSDSDNLDNINTTQADKKKLILKKFEELGLDPANVIFSDTIDSSNAITVESLKDLENVMSHEIYLEKNKEIINNINSKEFSEISNSDYSNNRYYDGTNYGYTSFQTEVPVPQLFSLFKRNMSLFISFQYERFELQNTYGESGIRNVSSTLIGLTFGYSYDHIDFYHRGSGAMTVQLTINGVLNRNIFFEGIGTIYRSNVKTIGYFVPRKNNTYEGQFRVVSI
ncbi:hypothetical protein LPB87_19035 [Flavobacterium sp. EDS]|uniref:hypothetical protein n=1 Tax=Flavobacterium sp. EDS TaxID=2897328 RepID=UPI001E474FD7|nr:hypothetical protein [Flavobacterium sp. EDS]MCD0476494.1 hypothetical protein [Flavobacterium sp. EDS]